MKTLIQNLFHRFISWWRDHWHLSLENIALRHQVDVLKRSGKRPQFSSSDRCFWSLLSRLWSRWPQSLEIMQANTVRRWRRQGIWRQLKWRPGRKQPGRPPIPAETRNFIRDISRDNRLWGAPRICGEFAKLGINVSPTMVAKYKVRRSYPPSPTWRTFIRNQAPDRVVAEVYAELSVQFRAVIGQYIEICRRWLGRILLHLPCPFRGSKEITGTENIDLVSVPATTELASADLVKLSSGSPPGTPSSFVIPSDQGSCRCPHGDRNGQRASTLIHGHWRSRVSVHVRPATISRHRANKRRFSAGRRLTMLMDELTVGTGGPASEGSDKRRYLFA